MVQYDRYRVEIEFVKECVGGIPKNENVLEAWVQSRGERKGADPKYLKKLIEKIKQEVEAEEDMEKYWTTFKRDDAGIYLEDRNVKAMLREAATTLEYFRGKGSTARKQTFQHGLFVKPDKIRFHRDGKVIREPEATQERAVHITTAMGPRSALKREDVVLPGARMTFEIWVVRPNGGEAHITKEMLRDWLELGQEIGLGASRSQQFGKFRVVRFERIG